MIKKVIIVPFLLFLSSLLFSLIADEVVYPVYLAKGAIIIDGKLDEEVWTYAPEACGFYKLGDPTVFVSKQSSFKIIYDKNNLYIGIEAEEENMKDLKMQSSDGGRVWDDDGFEIFIFPENSNMFYQFVISAAGSRYNGRGGPAPLWRWEAKVHRDKFFYSVEAKIPFEVFGKKPEKESLWKANIGRNTFTSNERYSTWSPINKRTFHLPEQFRILAFKSNPPSKAEVKKIEEEISIAFKKYQREYLFPLLKDTLSHYTENKEQLLMISSEPEFKKEATILIREWEKIKRLLKNKEIPKIKEIGSFKTLINRSKDLKLRFQTKERK